MEFVPPDFHEVPLDTYGPMGFYGLSIFNLSSFTTAQSP